MFRPCRLVNSWKSFEGLLCIHLQVRALQEELLLFDCLNLNIKAKGFFNASGTLHFQIRPKISQAFPVISVKSGVRLALSSVKRSIVFPLQPWGLSSGRTMPTLQPLGLSSWSIMLTLQPLDLSFWRTVLTLQPWCLSSWSTALALQPLGLSSWSKVLTLQPWGLSSWKPPGVEASAFGEY
jgi:hypothetical protein